MCDIPQVQEEFGVERSGQQHTTEKTSTSQDRSPPAKQDVQISCLNTTLIGDFTAAAFSDFDTKWLVQSAGNATFESITKGVNEGSILVDRKYVFLAVGANQVRSGERNKIFQQVLELVVAIRERNKDSRIFFTGILPRPVENLVIKTLHNKSQQVVGTSRGEGEGALRQNKVPPGSD